MKMSSIIILAFLLVLPLASAKIYMIEHQETRLGNPTDYNNSELALDIYGAMRVSGNITMNGSVVCSPTNGLCSVSGEPLWSGNQSLYYLKSNPYGFINTSEGGANNTMWNLSGNNLYTADHSYNVGIGTSSPDNILTVSGGNVAVRSPGNENRFLLQANSDEVDGIFGIYNQIQQQKIALRAGGNSWFIGGNTGFGENSPGAKVHASAEASTQIPMIAQGAASHSANLQEWQNSSGGVLSSMNSAGELNLPQVTDHTTPTLSFGDGDTGFYEASDDNLYVVSGATKVGYFVASGYFGNNNDAGGVVNEAASSTNPTLIPQRLDFDTGLGWAGADNLSLITGGVEAVRIQDDQDVNFNGNVGIGTSSPGSELDVNGVINWGNSAGRLTYDTGRTLIQSFAGYRLGLGVNSEDMTIISSGNVGIGTSSPAAPLHILYNSSVQGFNGLTLENVGASNRDVVMHYDSLAGDWTIGLDDNHADSFVFAASNDLNSNIRMVIQETGNVGIGESSPGAQLDVESQSSTNIGLIVQGAASQSANLQEWQNSSGGTLSSINSAGELNLPLVNDATTPTLSFGDGDTGMYEAVDDLIGVAIAGVGEFSFASSGFQVLGTDNPMLLTEAATSTNPTVLPSSSDFNTGLGWAGADNLSLITGGVEAVRITDVQNVTITNLQGTYGSGSAYVCVYDDGTLFASDSACP